MSRNTSRKSGHSLEVLVKHKIRPRRQPPSFISYPIREIIAGKRLNLTSLRFQTLDDMVEAIGLPREKLCTYCWDGCKGREACAASTAKPPA